LGGRLRGSAA